MRTLIFLGFALCAFFACKKAENYPETPVIEFKDYLKITAANGSDSSLKLTITFMDGDGDIGYNDPENDPLFIDEDSKYYYNLVYDLYFKENDSLKKFVFSGPSGFRIPNLTPEGRNKNIKGEIEIDIDLEDLKSDLIEDTIYYELFIYDRALHKSNVIRTPEIISKQTP